MDTEVERTTSEDVVFKKENTDSIQKIEKEAGED